MKVFSESKNKINLHRLKNTNNEIKVGTMESVVRHCRQQIIIN